MLQQMVVIIPLSELLGTPPMFINTEHPVPNVALAVPVTVQPSPKAAACESPIMLPIFTGLSNNPSKSLPPKSDADGLICGRLSFSNPNCASNCLFHCKLCRLKNNVLDAFV